ISGRVPFLPKPARGSGGLVWPRLKGRRPLAVFEPRYLAAVWIYDADAYLAAAHTTFLNCGKCGHAERDHNVDLVARLVFLLAPAPRVLDGNGALHRQPDRAVPVGNDALRLDCLIKVAGRVGQVARSLRELYHRHASPL